MPRIAPTCATLAALAFIGGASRLAFSADAVVTDYKHLGPASCASSACHGKLAAQPTSRVALNEYRVWTLEDSHSRAYKTLDSAASKAIAQKLGLPSAKASDLCLNCHADNVPMVRRGPKFQIDDGVGCEACHGGAEKWIESHAAKTATHAANVARGMYPTDVPASRARLCVSCHVGSENKFATHAIMGAGHPRLSFELEAFTTNQPAHYVVDADYIERKGKPEGMNLWVTGQLVSAERYLALLQSRLFQPSGMFPELAFYDCHGCHHRMDDVRWTPGRVGPGIRPGTLRLQKQHFVTLQAVTEVIGPSGGAASFAEARQALIRAGHSDAAAVRGAAAKLLEWIRAREAWSRRAFSRAEIVSVRAALLRYAAADQASDYAAAEQIVLGVESLSYSLGDRDRRKAALDSLYEAVKNGSTFNPAKFAETARRVQGGF